VVGLAPQVLLPKALLPEAEALHVLVVVTEGSEPKWCTLKKKNKTKKNEKKKKKKKKKKLSQAERHSCIGAGSAVSVTVCSCDPSSIKVLIYCLLHLRHCCNIMTPSETSHTSV